MSRRGFTLVELMVALAVAGLVLLTAGRVMAATISGGDALRDARRSLDREMNGRRLLSAAILSLQVDGAQDAFEGRSDRVRFSTWRQTPGGWYERRPVELRLDGSALVLAEQAAGSTVLADDVRAVALDYLLQGGAESRWVSEWTSPVSAPVALRLRLMRRSGRGTVADTTIYLVKGRG